jgi:hypothetical protein
MGTFTKAKQKKEVIVGGFKKVEIMRRNIF